MSIKNKTIREIAAEIGVSKQAIFKRIKKEPLSTSLREFMTTIDNTVVIDVDGVDLIKQAFFKPTQTTIHDNLTTTIDAKLIEELMQQLNEKDRQIEHLNEQLSTTLRIVDQQQQLTATMQKNALLEAPRRSVWQRLTGK